MHKKNILCNIKMWKLISITPSERETKKYKAVFEDGEKKKTVHFGAYGMDDYTITKDTEISFLGRTVRFNKGDQIITAVSYKYDKDDFMSFLKMYFSDVNLFVSKDGSYALALCKK
jgi:uncharacterized SAM-dependent methyltransferase